MQYWTTPADKNGGAVYQPPFIENLLFDEVCKEVLAEQEQRYKDWLVESSKKALNGSDFISQYSTLNNSQ